MLANPPLRVAMSARAAIAVRRPFSDSHLQLSNAEVARDEIASFRPPVEPVVLRVQADGGTEAERDSVQGDWLCEPDGSPPERLSRPQWQYESGEWVGNREWVEAWEECVQAPWMVEACASLPIDTRRLVRIACAAARSCFHLVPASETAPADAIEFAERWTRSRPMAQLRRVAINFSARAHNNEVTLSGIRLVGATREAAGRHDDDAPQTSPTAPGYASRNVYYAIMVASYAAQAAADAAEMDLIRGAHAAHEHVRRRLVRSVAFAARAASGFHGMVEGEEISDMVRAEVPTIVVLRAVRDVATRATPR